MRHTLISLGAVALSLSGCISLLPDSGDLPPRVTLDAGAPKTTGTEQLDVTLVVADPSAAAVYNTFFVALATGPLEYQYLSTAQWSDRVPVLIRRFMERRFENEGVFLAVGDRADIPSSDYTLQTDIRAFHLENSGGSLAARATFGLRLVDARGNILGTKLVDKRVEVRGGSSNNFTALNSAAQQAADEIFVWMEDIARAE